MQAVTKKTKATMLNVKICFIIRLFWMPNGATLGLRGALGREGYRVRLPRCQVDRKSKKSPHRQHNGKSDSSSEWLESVNPSPPISPPISPHILTYPHISPPWVYVRVFIRR